MPTLSVDIRLEHSPEVQRFWELLERLFLAEPTEARSEAVERFLRLGDAAFELRRVDARDSSARAELIDHHPAAWDRDEAEQIFQAAAFLAGVARDRGFVLRIEQEQCKPEMGAHLDLVSVNAARVDGAYPKAKP